MNREEKTVIINSLADKLQQYAHFYLTDTSELNAEQTAKLRRVCFEKDVKLVVVKNTLFIKALEQVSKADAELMPALKGETSVMFSDTGKSPCQADQRVPQGISQAGAQSCRGRGLRLSGRRVDRRSGEHQVS